jgi:hypothetical protein
MKNEDIIAMMYGLIVYLFYICKLIKEWPTVELPED